MFLSLKLSCISFEPKGIARLKYWIAICITWENSYVSQFALNMGILVLFGVGKDHSLKIK